MVLGILSVMVILAVAFAISMRTERVAAGNYADSVRARQLVEVGLARAMNDLATNLGIGGLTSSVARVYPPWTVTNSYTTAYTNTAANLYLVYATNGSTKANHATNFVPRALWTAATNADYRNAANHWLPIENIVYTNDLAGNPWPSDTNLLGRVKYLILNCSGLLDANFAGGAGRGIGTNAKEIAISNMPEFKLAGATAFLTRRDTGSPPPPDYRYETLEELAALNNVAAFNEYPTNFTVYSHAPPGCWATNATISNQVNLAGDTNQLVLRISAISNAFVQAGFGFDPNQAMILYSNLIDYVDRNSEPENLLTCVEPVPMINEIAFHSYSSNATAINTVQVELWFPFAKFNTDGKFDFILEYTVRSIPNNFSEGVTNTWTNQAALSANEFRANDFTLAHFGQITNADYEFTLNTVEVRSTNGLLYDKMIVLPPPITVHLDGPQQSTECVDPRFNWDYPSQWAPFSSAHVTLGEINYATTNYWKTHPDCDQDGMMYVANQPLQSVGELGYLTYDTWKTIKLYGPNCQRVLDVFAIGTNASYAYVTNTIWRGRVNPNTHEINVLSAVFSNMPLDEYPGQGLHPLSAAEVQAVVSNIQANAFYTNLSDIGRNFTTFPSTATNELQKEAIFRNSVGLLSVRQNLFTIVIEAQAASGGNIPRYPVRQRAVALVWRDPYTGEMFVRSLKWLKD